MGKFICYIAGFVIGTLLLQWFIFITDALNFNKLFIIVYHEKRLGAESVCHPISSMKISLYIIIVVTY